VSCHQPTSREPLLCHEAEKKLISRNYRQVVLWVFEGNAAARRFYEAMGFEVDGASKTLNPGTPLQAIRYRKQLEVAEQSIELDRDGDIG